MSTVLRTLFGVALAVSCLAAAGCGSHGGSHRNEAKVDAVDWPGDPCTFATTDQVSRALGAPVGQPEPSGTPYLPFGQRYCIWKTASGGSVTIETFTDASVRATQDMSANSAGGSANEVFQSFPSGESLERDLGVPSRWNDGVDALVGDTYVSISASGVEKDMRPSLMLLAESVVGRARQAGGATTSTGAS